MFTSGSAPAALKPEGSGRELQNARNRPLSLLHLEVFSRELWKGFLDASGPPWMRTFSLDFLPALLPSSDSTVILSWVDTFSMMAPRCAPVQAPSGPRAFPSGSAPSFRSPQLLRVEDEQLCDRPLPLFHCAFWPSMSALPRALARGALLPAAC